MRIGVRLGPFYASTRVRTRSSGRAGLGCALAFVSLPLLGVLVAGVVMVVRGAEAVTAKQWLIGGGIALASFAAIVWLTRTRWTHPIPPPQAGDECAAIAPSDLFTHASGTHLCSLPVPHPAHECGCGHAWPVYGLADPAR